MTRNGKIARLPQAIRQELNHRLQDGQKGRLLIAWLNGLPEVQTVLAAEFHGQPIAEDNLSRWKSGGYRTWQDEQNTRDAAIAMIEESPVLQEAGKKGLADRMAFFISAKMALQLRGLNRLPDGARKSEMWRELLDQFIRLRRGELQGERLRLELEKSGLGRDLSDPPA